MRALFSFFLTFFFFVTTLALYSKDVAYYYESAFRPPDGWHRQTGSFLVENATSISPSSTSCNLATFENQLHSNVDSVYYVTQGLPWSVNSGLCMAWCNYTDLSVFVTHCFSRQCGVINDLGQGNILVGAIASNYTKPNSGNRPQDFVSYKIYRLSSYNKFYSWQCLSNMTSVYLNGDLVFQSPASQLITAAGVVYTGGTLSYSATSTIDAIVNFVNGTARSIIPCDSSPLGILACTYDTGYFTDGFYPISNQTQPEKTLEVYLSGAVLNTTYEGSLANFTFFNVSGVEPISIGPHNEPLTQLRKLQLFQNFTASEQYYYLDFSFLNQFEFIPYGPTQGFSSNYGSIYGQCGFELSSINNGHCFNSLSISITYLPKYWGCYEALNYFGAQCCYMYSYKGPNYCYGISPNTGDYRYECVLAVLLFMQQGSRVCTSTTNPILYDVSVLNNTFVLNECVNYTIYSRYGYGYVTNVTDMVTDDVLESNGLVLLDSSGAIDLFAVNNVYGRQFYKINPCDDVNEQLVVLNNTILGKLTSINCTDCEFLTTQYYQSYVQPAQRRLRRSLSGNVTECPYLTFGEHCFYPDGSVHFVQPSTFDTLFEPLLNVSESILIPDSFNLTVTEEYIQTQMEQIQLNCVQYVCGTSVQCRNLFKQYGSVCDNILAILNGVSQSENQELISMYSSTLPGQSFEPVSVGMDTGNFNLSLLLPNSNNKDSRSFIEDLLFTKVESVGLPTDQAYLDCLKGMFVRDLICAQYYNGIMVLPPIITGQMQFMYTSSFIASMAWGGLTAAGAIPFATQIQARINHLGITQTLLLDNQQMLAESFNNAVQYMQQGFQATSTALQQIQDVVNQQGAVLQEVLNSLNKNFGAVSSVIQDIYKSLDELSANAQIDRLITGRLSALSVLASSKQAEHLRLQQQRQLALDKLNECVLSQSLRNSFCGSGKHVMTIPQTAPNGMVFVHFTYTPQTFRNVTAVVGFCVRSNTTDSSYEYGLVPVNGRGVFIQIDGVYYITSRDMYMPRNITAGDVVTLTSCQANYVYVSRTVVTTFVDDSDFDFDAEFDKWWNETQHDFPQFDEFNYTVPLLNITQQIQDIQDAIQGLNDSYVNLHELSKLTTYIKWPWYVWLAIAFLTIIFFLILGWIFFMTGCCGGCCGCCGLIPLAQRCSKRSSYYQTFDDDVVGERIRQRKNV
ncbi:spike protein [Anser fabalis coronavirus NCN2]|nr:spike protein [Anser fabalis coronavirus NCN2]